MSMFLIVAGRNPERLAAAIKECFPDQHFQVFENAWLVNASMTTKEVSLELEIPDGVIGSQAIVVPVTNYSGWAPKGVWEWLRSRDSVATSG